MSHVDMHDILIIEDAKPLAVLLCEYLKKLNYQKIHYCENGTLGIKKFQEQVKSNNIPVVFLDSQLSDISAVRVLMKILEIHPNTYVIIETVSNHSEFGMNMLFELGAYRYIPKPYKFEKLKEIMYTIEMHSN